MADTINLFSLCSGVGWLDEGVRIGLEYLGVGSQVLGYCERDGYAAACLLARMEDAALEPAPIWCGNLEDMDRSGLRDRVDLVSAGFPCQPWSSAGRQAGVDDDRWLWPAIVEIISDVRPRMVFLENVPGLVSGCGLNHVLDSLAVLGFDAEWTDREAAEVGASHARWRVFILAYRRGGRTRESWLASARQPEQQSRRAVEPCGHGRELANAKRSRRRKVLESSSSGRSHLAGRGEALADTECASRGAEQRHHAREREGGAAIDEPMPRGFGERVAPVFAPGPGDIDGWNAVVADGSFDFRAPAVKPGVRVLADGCALVVDASRADQLRCSGNGVVALQAAAAFVELVRRVTVKDQP